AGDDPVPAPDVGDALGLGQAGLAVAEHVLRPLAVGDVLGDAVDPDRLALGVDLDAAARPEVPDLAAVADDAVLVLERLRLLEPVLDDRPGPGLVVGVDPRNDALERGVELLRVDPPDPVHLVGPEDLLRLEVVFPTSDMGDALGVGELRLAVAEQ